MLLEKYLGLKFQFNIASSVFNAYWLFVKLK